MDGETKSADSQLIRRILPHRYPFLLVDKVIAIDAAKSAIGIKNVTVNEPYFMGHFPDNPVMPGVTVIEAMAQTAAVMVGTTFEYTDQNLKVYFMAIDKCKFRRMVVPGDVMMMHVATLRGRRGEKVWKFRGEARVEDQVAASAEFTAMMEMPRQ